MERIAAIESIQKGDPITVLGWKSLRDRSWVGETFIVRSVDAPFICVNGSRRYNSRPMVFDFREMDFAEPSDEFLKSVRPEVAGS